MTRRIPAVAIAFTLMLSAATAFADRVANVHARGTASADDRARVEKAAGDAIHALGDTTPEPKEIVDGEAAAGSLIGTSAGLVAVGKTTGSEWVVEATVAPRAAGLRLDLKVCKVASGRVETASRDLDLGGDLVAQIKEMLALMLRPQGIADDPLPWLGGPPAAPASPKPPEPPPKPPVPTPGAPATPPLPPPEYGRPGSVLMGIGGGAYGILARPNDARGGRTLGAFDVDVGYSLPSMRQLEFTALVGGYFGPAGALRIEGGARYMWPLTRAVALGAAASVGVLAATTSSATVRLTLGASPVVAIALGGPFQLDLIAPSLRVSPGAGGALGFLGGEASLVYRL